MYILYSENKDSDQLRGYHAADLCFVSAYVKRFFHYMAQLGCSLTSTMSQVFQPGQAKT